MDGGLSLSALVHGLGNDVRSGQFTAWANTAWLCAQVAASLAVLIAEWDKPCDQRLNLWLAVATCRIILRLVLSRSVVKLISRGIERSRRMALVASAAPDASSSSSSPPSEVDALGAVEMQRPRRQGRRHQPEEQPQPDEQAPTAARRSRRRQQEQEQQQQQEQEQQRRRREQAAAVEEDQENAMVVEKVKEVLDVFSLVWFTLGNAWVFGSRSCSRTSPGIFYLSLSIIVVTCR
jgi:hypothetical protein